MLNIIIIYILDFYLNDRYDIRYSLYKNFTGNDEENNKMEEYNPHLNFSIDMKKITQNLNESDLSESFIIMNDNFSLIEKNTVISSTPTNMSFMIVYVCFDNCSLEEHDYTDLTYVLKMTYPGYKIDHQSDEIPLEKNSDKYPFYKELFFSFSKTTFYDINWGIIKYKEERGLLGLFDNLFNKKNVYTSIDIDSIEPTSTERGIELADPEIPFIKFKILCIINMNNDHNQYIEYVRLKKSLLDVFANIGALFSSIFTVFNFIFQFYSQNFNNHMIIKEILSSHKTEILYNDIKIPRSKTIKFDNINRKNKNVLYEDNKSFDISKSVPFKSKGINITNKIKMKKDENEGNNKNDDNINKNFGNLIEVNFIQFLLINVWCKRKNKAKEQEIIDICNNILSKYTSIDVILYNQIIFENLLKDYKWSSNDLSNIESNSLIKQLKLMT